MLAKQQRLKRDDFSKHFKLGKRFNSPYATLVVSDSVTFHGAVVVSKKVSKKAVSRNALRRRAYAQLYKNARQVDKGVYILILKPEISSLSRASQHETLAKLIEEGLKRTYNSSHV